MNVKKIVVDELPNMCIDCKLSFYSRDNEVYICFATKNRIANSQVIPEACPLEVEEVCEWVWEEYEMCISPHNNGNWCDKDEYQFCPTCGKRIKYVEVSDGTLSKKV